MIAEIIKPGMTVWELGHFNAVKQQVVAIVHRDGVNFANRPYFLAKYESLFATEAEAIDAMLRRAEYELYAAQMAVKSAEATYNRLFKKYRNRNAAQTPAEASA